MRITGCAICMNGGVKKRFWSFAGTEQDKTMSFSAAHDLSVSRNLVFDGCNKNLGGKRKPNSPSELTEFFPYRLA